MSLSPGYDIGVCLSRVGYLYDAAFYLGVLKKHWLGGANGDVLRAAEPELVRRMAEAPDMHSFMAAASPFSAARPASAAPSSADAGTVANGFAAFLAASNPMGVAHQIQVPALILNSDDDPICSAANTDDNLEPLIARGGCSKAVALVYPRGGHCCFASGWRAHRFGDQLAADFLAAVARARPPGSSTLL